ncbi:MAG: tetratricopeptide repeat protein [Bacteroidales bacterium]|nr:tetratricopeptide repeat protein [Bacteroidales bacterium]
MNKAYIYLLIPLALALAGCRQQALDGDMPDSVKLEVLDLNLERKPDDAKLLAARARVLLNMGRVKEAAYDINRAVSLEPDNVQYLMLKSDISFANGSIEESYRTLDAADHLAPGNIEIQLKLGEITFYSRDYDRSLVYLSSVTEREPNNRTALFMRGYIYKEKGDTANAVKLLRQVTDRFPDYAPAFEELGILYAIRLNPLAAEYLGTAIELEPNNTNAIYALAMFHQECGDFEAAENLYHQLLVINPHSADAWHNLGWIALTQSGDFAQAVEYFDKALEAAPGMASAIENRQLALDAMK